MQDGLVYLRPVQVAYLRTNTVRRDAARALWDDLRTILKDQGVVDQVDRLYGLAHGPEQFPEATADPHYVACVGIVPGLKLSPKSQLQAMTLPGGAYMRQRVFGSDGDVAGGFGDLCDISNAHHDIKLDQIRPLVEIHIGDGLRTAVDHKIELCVPVKPRVA